MPTVKRLGDRLGVQCTKQARTAGLAAIDRPDDAARSVDVQGERAWIVACGPLVLAGGVEAIDGRDWLALVDAALSEHAGLSGMPIEQLAQSGEGVALPLPPSVVAAGDYRKGDEVTVEPLPDVLVVSPRGRNVTRLTGDLRTLREEQLR